MFWLMVVSFDSEHVFAQHLYKNAPVFLYMEKI